MLAVAGRPVVKNPVARKYRYCSLAMHIEYVASTDLNEVPILLCLSL